MRLKKISMENIRSYENQEVEFPEGSMLLSGDIGSGKTSILLGTEFALFGLQPGQRASSILRNGKNSGKVSIELEIEKKEIIIERSLEKNRTISQDYCSITIDGKKKETSVTELKNDVLELLNYPKEFSKKQNMLYKFTIYTPQEEMKQIMLQDGDARTNTLRHIFGIDRYKRVLENVSILTSKIREEIKLKEGAAENLEQDRNELASEERKIEIKNRDVALAEKELSEKSAKRKELEEEKNRLSEKREEKNRKETEIREKKKMKEIKEESFSGNLQIISRLREQIKELEKAKVDEDRIKRIDEELESVKKDREELNGKILETKVDETKKSEDVKLKKIENEIESLKKIREELNGKILETKHKINSLESDNADKEEERKKISSLEVCPTCLQDVDESYRNKVFEKIKKTVIENGEKISVFQERLNKLKEEIDGKNSEIDLKEKEIAELKETKIKIFQERLNKLKEEIDGKNSEIDLKEKEIAELKETKTNKMREIAEKQSRLSEIEKSNLALEEDVKSLDEEIKILEDSVAELRKSDAVLEEKQKEFDETFRQERTIEVRAAELKKETEMISGQIESLKKRIKKSEDARKRIEHLAGTKEWLSGEFSSLVSAIEKNFMLKLKSEFSKSFSEWFSMLVSDNFNASLGDDFTPIIEYQDYEINYQHLSGGERTAIALAYRLSLNQVINSLLSDIKTKDIIILDEPTDGFSGQQLDRMREVLEQLNVGQMIIVSHEQKIESFVDNVIRFRKENGISVIDGS